MRTTRDLRSTVALALVTVLCAPVGVVALPGVAVARTVEVAPVTGLGAEAYVDEVTLTWQNPVAPGLATAVRGAPGKVAPSSPTDGFDVAVGSGATTATALGLDSDTPYSFAVFARDLAGEYAAPATVTVSSLLVSISLPATAVLGAPVTLSGRVTDAITGAPAPSTPVHIFGVPLRTDELVPITEVSTQPDGRYTVAVTPPEHARFVAIAGGDAQHLAGGAVSRAIKIYAAVSLRALGRTNPLGTLFRLRATADPISTTVPLVLQERVGKKWKTVLRKKPNARGVALLQVKPTTQGKHRYRVKRGPVPGIAVGTSRTVTITAR